MLGVTLTALQCDGGATFNELIYFLVVCCMYIQIKLYFHLKIIILLERKDSHWSKASVTHLVLLHALYTYLHPPDNLQKNKPNHVTNYHMSVTRVTIVTVYLIIIK